MGQQYSTAEKAHGIDVDAWRIKLDKLDFRGARGWYIDSDFLVSDFMKLLRAEPTLASEIFTQMHLSPLSILVQHPDANLEQVKEVYNMYPPAVEHEDAHGALPIMHTTGSRDPYVFLFLAEKYPKALAKVNKEETVLDQACESMWNFSPPFHFVQQVFGFAENYFRHTKTEIIDPMFFKFALKKTGRNSEQFNYLLSKVGFTGGALEAPSMDIFCANALAAHLHRLSSLTIESGGSCEGLLHLTKFLGTNKSILNLCINVPTLAWGNGSGGDPYGSLRELIVSNTTIENLHFVFGHGDGYEWNGFTNVNNFRDDCIQALHSSLERQSRTSIKSLHLSGFSLSDPNVLGRFLSSNCAPKHISLAGIEINKSVCCESFPGGVIESLDLRCRLSKWWHDFLLQCGEESLITLGVFEPSADLESRTKELDQTAECISKLLLKGKLQSLTMDDELNGKICGALKSKSCQLRRLGTVWDVLNEKEETKSCVEEALINHGNTTLTEIVDELFGRLRFSRYMDKAVCYARLNACGRGRCRSNATKIEDVVDMLCPATMKLRTQVEWKSQKLDGVVTDNEIHQLQYGLLRETPSLWCSTNVLTRKRDGPY